MHLASFPSLHLPTLFTDEPKKTTQKQIIVATRAFLKYEADWSARMNASCGVTSISGNSAPSKDTGVDIVTVAPTIPLPAVDRSRPKTYSAALLDQMLKECHSKRDKAIVSLFHEGGLRLGELLGMRLSDLDFGATAIWIKSRDDNPNGATLKTRARGERFLRLPPEVMALIEEYIVNERFEITHHSMLWINLEKRTRGLYGSPLKKSAINALFRRFRRALSVEVLHPHMTRHTHATSMAGEQNKSGQVDYGVIANRLGISTEMARKTYIHLDDEHHRIQYERYAESKKRQRTDESGV
jgi:integrase/recombinase XerD